MSKKEMNLKGVMSRDQVVAYLEDLIAGLKAGRICVQQGEQFVALCPEQLINVEIQASVKKGKEKFEMELDWRKEKTFGEISDMHIFASGPETPVGAAQELLAVSRPAIEVQASETPGPAAEATNLCLCGKAPNLCICGKAPKTGGEAPKAAGEAPKTGGEAGEASGEAPKTAEEAGEASGIKGKKGK